MRYSKQKMHSFFSCMFLVALDMTGWGILLGGLFALFFEETSVWGQTVNMETCFVGGLVLGSLIGLWIGLLYLSGVLPKALYYVLALVRYLALAAPVAAMVLVIVVSATESLASGFDGLGLVLLMFVCGVVIFFEFCLFVIALGVATLAVGLLRHYHYKRAIYE